MGHIERTQCRILHDDGISRLGGRNVGQYPRHHFYGDYHPSSTLPLQINVCGEDEWVKDCCRFRDHSEVFAVELVTAGTFVLETDAQRYLVKPGEIMLLHLGDSYEMYLTDGDYARKKIVSFTGFLAPAFSGSAQLGQTHHCRSGRTAQLEALIDEIIGEYRDRRSGYPERAALLGYRLLQEISGELGRTELPVRLAELVRFINDNYHLPLSIDQLCRKFGFSPATLHRLFKKYLASSPIEYQITCRMNAARRMLGFTALPIKEIARRLGYANQLYFATEFRRHCDCPPREFRRASTLRM